LKPWFELIKIRITAASTVTTLVGYVMARGRFDMPLVPVLVGILLQACGAAALNHVQDARLDTRMGRTAGRPIPAGRVTRRGALLGALVLLAAGTAVSWLAYGPVPALLGLGAAAEASRLAGRDADAVSFYRRIMEVYDVQIQRPLDEYLGHASFIARVRADAEGYAEVA